MTPRPPILAYAIPPLSFLLILPAVWIFIVISSVLLVILPFAYFEAPDMWRPILKLNGLSLLILLTLGVMLHTSHPTFTVGFSWTAALITFGLAALTFIALLIEKIRKWSSRRAHHRGQHMAISRITTPRPSAPAAIPQGPAPPG